jgi:hypothetical protein
MLGVPAAAAAQSSASADATVSATVVAALTLTKNADLDFGTVGLNTIATVAFTDAAAANWSAAGQANTPVTVTFPPSISLTETGGQSMTFNASMGSHPTTQASAAALSSGNSVNLDASGNHGFWLGGNIDTGTVTNTGVYSGVFSLTVEY